MSYDILDCKVLKCLLNSTIPVEQFVLTLEKQSISISDIKVEDTAKGHITLLQEPKTFIRIKEVQSTSFVTMTRYSGFDCLQSPPEVLNETREPNLLP